MVYLDNNATTPVDRRVYEAMSPYLFEKFGNPSTLYSIGAEARAAVEEARKRVADLVGARPDEIVFTGCGSESDNMALKGVAFAHMERGKHIIVSSIEHHAVLNTAAYLEKIGFEVTYLPVDRHGLVDPNDLRRAIRSDTVLVSIMLANNEIGTIQPVKELCSVSHEKGVLFHTDAVQAAGKLKIDVEELGVDLLSLSAHKIYGPKGVGALYIRKGTKIHPLIHGGHQERGRRAGTENVAGIVGFGKAAEIALQEMEEEVVRIAELRDRLEMGILERIEDVIVNGHPEKRLPNTTNISFCYIEGEAIILKLASRGIYASTGSACSSDTLEPSHVLMAIGLSPEVGHGSVRFSLGKFNTADDVDRTLEVLPEVVSNLREMSPFWRRKNVQR